MTSEKAYSELIRRVKDAAILSACGSVLGWDERTYMPRNGGVFRGEQMALLARLAHEMATALRSVKRWPKWKVHQSLPIQPRMPRPMSARFAAPTIGQSSCPRNWLKNWRA